MYLPPCRTTGARKAADIRSSVSCLSRSPPCWRANATSWASYAGGRRLSRETLETIGIGRCRVPAPSVWCELFQQLDVTSLEQALGGWVTGPAPATGHVAIDGKRLRGSATAQAPGTHLLAAFSASLQGVIGQLRVPPESNEIAAAMQLLKTLPLKGVVVTGDAIFTQTEICKVIVDGGGDYFFTVKGNQPTLKSDIAEAFRPFSPLRALVSAA